VKICDFGLSRYISNATEVRALLLFANYSNLIEIETLKLILWNGNVKVRELFGTVDYLSPEVLSYEPITLTTDCWAIGGKVKKFSHFSF